MHVDLLNGQSAELRDPETVTRLERRELLAKIRAAAKDEGEEGDGSIGTNLIFAALIESWTLDLVLPSEDLDVVDRLLALDETKIDKAATGIMRKLLGSSNFEESTEPDSPTKPSND